MKVKHLIAKLELVDPEADVWLSAWDGIHANVSTNSANGVIKKYDMSGNLTVVVTSAQLNPHDSDVV